MSDTKKKHQITPNEPKAFLNRELSWLAFARRVLSLVEDEELQLLERVKFAGIMGMLHDEFFMKRMSGLKRQMLKKPRKRSLDGRTPDKEFELCRNELLDQDAALANAIEEQLRPALAREGIPILKYEGLTEAQRRKLREYFRRSVEPILTPLAVDAEHPFPFISNLGLNLAILLPDQKADKERFVRLKVPDNRPRWVPVPGTDGYVPLEQVIAANLDLTFQTPPREVYPFRVTRGIKGAQSRLTDLEQDDPLRAPGVIVQLVSHELKARKFAGGVRLHVNPSMPKKRLKWFTEQLAVTGDDVYPMASLGRAADLLQFDVPNRDDLRAPLYTPATHKRLRGLVERGPGAIFDEIRQGDILVHHPYHSFDSSVLEFIEAAAGDPNVLAIKLTIYRTSSQSPIVQALVEAARHGKQVAVLVEITARFDEAPNIAWGKLLEEEGVHVTYGAEQLKTHIKVALVVREEGGGVRRYAHFGTGNYHTGTARVYEDIGLLTCDEALCDDAAAVFNALTGATAHGKYQKLIVAPIAMRERFQAMIKREIEHARANRAAGIRAKMNQLQDPDMIRELYRASQEGVPIILYVRGLCCLRPGVPGLSDNIRVVAVVGRFLEHSRIYSFTNGGEVEYYIGSADWMQRNLDRRVETIAPVLDPAIGRQLGEILDVYDNDNYSAWDCGPGGIYTRRRPAKDEPPRAAQQVLIDRASEGGDPADGVKTPGITPRSIAADG
jgi:polyphosphate kinase